MNKEVQKPESDIFIAIKQVVESARAKSYRAINSFLLESYWQIGKLIVEDEQKGASRATYGEGVLKNLANALTQEFGKGFDLRNLNNMRAFYLAFPIWNALRTELSWTHYRLISRLETAEKRLYYIAQAVENGWNSRELERNIGIATIYWRLFLGSYCLLHKKVFVLARS